MCAITGLLTSDFGGQARSADIVFKMSERLAHRGPDDRGLWNDPEHGVVLGHRRLAVIDLSEMGKQPMLSETGRYVLVYNGEVYNFKDIRRELEQDRAQQPRFRGDSDTEVMLAAFERWGILESARRFIGMFAFAAWDRKENCLYLVRDRLGEKPLYYGWAGKDLLFASELKAFREHPDFKNPLSPSALSLYLRYNSVPSPYSIFEGVYKLPPGCLLKIPRSLANHPARINPQPSDGKQNGSFQPLRYWSARDAAEGGLKAPLDLSESEAVSELGKLLSHAVRIRMAADVPLGAFLSGGLDSSTIVALMQAQSPRPVKTFTIGFDVKAFDEAAHAGAVAGRLGTDHTELYLTPQDALDVVPRLPEIYDEPFADASQIPTYLVSRLAKRHVTVALSGDGGDELFGGYNRYFLVPSIWRKTAWIPQPLRNALAELLLLPGPDAWESALSFAAPLLARYGKNGSFGDKFHKLAAVLKMRDPDVLYQRLLSYWPDPREALRSSAPAHPIEDKPCETNIADPELRMMLFDTLAYLPDDILVKVDRASMAVSLEARAPFLDHRVMEFAWRLPLDLKIRDGKGKWIIRALLEKYIPNEIFERPKMGFGVPIPLWLRGPLRDWAEDLLSENSLHRSGLLNPDGIRRVWKEHLAGTHSREDQLWSVLMFQQWLRHFES